LEGFFSSLLYARAAARFFGFLGALARVRERLFVRESTTSLAINGMT